MLFRSDCDIIHHNEQRQIIPMLLGAAELGQNREVSWETARKNSLMEEFNVPHNFQFEGSIIWITNDRKVDIAKAIIEKDLKAIEKAVAEHINHLRANMHEIVSSMEALFGRPA